MAIKLADALVFLGVDDKGLASGLDKASEKTKGWAAGLGGKAAALLGGALVAGAVAAAGAVAGIGIAAFAMSSKIEQAVKKATAQLGLTDVAAEEFGTMLKTVYGEGFGQSIDDVSDSLGTVVKNLDPLMEKGEDFLVGLTEQALALRDAFGIDVAESTRTASILMARLGVSGEEAMAMITAGFQNGLNRADDLLDTLNEYADDFGEMGFSAEEALGFLNRGLEAGIFNTDKIGDALNEFKVNLKDPAIRDQLHEIDGGIAAIYDQFHAGQITAAEAFQGIMQGLSDLDDPIARDQIGVLFMRSMWEDLGDEAILALGDMERGLIDVAGAGDTLMTQYDNLPAFFEGMKRRAVLALTPLGDKLLALANEHMPLIESAFAWLEAQLPAVVDKLAGFIDNAIQFVGNLKASLSGLGESAWVQAILAAVEQVKAWFVENWPMIQAVAITAWTIIQDVVKAVADVIVKDVWPKIKEAFDHLTGALNALGLDWGDVFGALGTVVKVVAAVIGAILLALVAVIVGIANTIAAIIEKVTGGYEKMAEGIRLITEGKIIEGVLKVLEGAWDTTFGALIAGVKGFVEGVIGFFTDLYNRLVGHSLIPDLVSDILRLFGSVNLSDVGKRMIEGLIGGIEGMRGRLQAKVQDIAANLPDWAKGPLGIHSPSAIFEGIGQNVMAGLSAGLLSALPPVQAQLALAMRGLALAGAGAAGGPPVLNQHFYGIPGLGTQREAGDAGFRVLQDLNERGYFGRT